MAQRIATPLEPTVLRSLLSTSALSKKQIKSIIAALKNFNKAVDAAGKRFERDLKKSLTH